MFRSHSKKGKYALFFAVTIVGAFLLTGCAGDDGATGPPGPPGATGATGPAGPGPDGSSATTDESCVVCHSAGKIADISLAHPDPTGKDVTLSNITLANVGGVPVVTFHLATDTGPVTDVTFGDVRFYIADLVPADTATKWGTWSSPYFERWAYERSSTAGAIFGSSGRSTQL